jgi:hypothetical protein
VVTFRRCCRERALTAARGVVSLAAAARTQPLPTLDGHVQLVAGGLPVLAGAASAAQVAALAPSWPAVIDTLTGVDDVDVIADCGRFSADDATGRLIAAAGVTVLVCRASVTSVAHTREVLVALGRRGDGSRPPEARVAVVVVGDPAEVREVGIALAAHTPVFVAGLDHNPTGAAGLCGAWSRRLDRSRLVVAARIVARQLDHVLVTDTTGRRATPPSAVQPSLPIATPVPIVVVR